LSEARLVTGSCDNSKAATAARANPLIEQMRREVDQAYTDYVARQPACWAQYRENEEYWREVKSRSGSLGLRLAGIGEGGGGMGYGTGIGLGAGFGSGYGRLGGSHAVRAARVHSGTNVQVEGVDEADLVKTDGKYVYLSINGALRIVEGLNPRVLSVTRIGGNVKDMFVEGDRAVVYSSIGAPNSERCTYGYDCSLMGDGSSTAISVLDISDRMQPKVVRKLELSGSLIAARRIGNTVHTVVSDGDTDKPPYDEWMDIPECGVRDRWVRKRVAQLKASNEARIRQYVAQWAPKLKEADAERSLCDNVWQSPIADGDAFTTLVSFDLRQDAKPAATTTLRSRPGAVFAATDALYVAVTHDHPRSRHHRYSPFGSAIDEISAIHKFHLGDTPEATRYIGSGVVPGHVLNQFALDEWYGYLRVASSRGRVPDPHVESSVSVLAEGPGGALLRVGAVDHLAPGEDIRAVRFDNDRGYVVTFKKTDPLFVIDLLSPAQPKLLGELKIPGFSTYLQRIDREHLISIGFNADDQGEFAYFNGLLLQLFDVQSPTEPKLLFRETIGTRGSGSDAATDHLAFNYLGERGLLAIPATVCEGGGNGNFGDKLTFSGLLVYHLDLQNGFQRLGGIDHGERGADCQQWWSRSTSVVKRSVFLDDFVYSIAGDRAKVQLLTNLGHDLADIDISR
jgi:hypothetical protein